MPISCPKCHNSLPEVETLKYRFCPHCGTEIPAKPKKLDNALLTIPPDLSERQPKQLADVLSPPTDENASTTRSFNDQTIEPQLVVKRSRPKINPPDTPPPASFFRISPEKKEPPPPDLKQQLPAKSHRNIIIAILILLVVVILIMGGIFTF
jgi:DNA-directed RNA polymerase subunit RPC12/RpoP